MVHHFCACTMDPYLLLLSSMASDVLVNLTKNANSGSGVKSRRLRSSTTSLKQFYQGYTDPPLPRIFKTHRIYRRKIEIGLLMHSTQRHDSCNSTLNSTPSGITDVTSYFTEFSQTSKGFAFSTTCLLFNICFSNQFRTRY